MHDGGSDAVPRARLVHHGLHAFLYLVHSQCTASKAALESVFCVKSFIVNQLHGMMALLDVAPAERCMTSGPGAPQYTSAVAAVLQQMIYYENQLMSPFELELVWRC